METKTSLELEEIRESIEDSTPKIKIKGVLKKRKENLEEFLIKFFTRWNKNRDTVFVNISDYSKIDNDEYYEGDDLSVQTYANSRRSLGDIYMICKYYYPNCTLTEVASLLYGKLFESIPRFRSSICSVIDKRVFYQGSELQPTNMMDRVDYDEYDMEVNEWRELLELNVEEE